VPAGREGWAALAEPRAGAHLPYCQGLGGPQTPHLGDCLSGHGQRSRRRGACSAAGADGQLPAMACLLCAGGSPAALTSLLLPAAELALPSGLLFA